MLPRVLSTETPNHRTARTMSLPALPLRLRQLLGEAPLDGIAQVRYGSAMNDPDAAPATLTADSPPAGNGATLFTFLDVAERLYERIARALGRVGLSYAKYELLEHLRAADGPVSLGSLAAAQSCARSNITQLIDRLESEGLVRRVEDPEDRRGVRAELTPQGTALAQEGATQLDLVRAEFAASFTAPERAELVRLLDKLR